MSWVGMGEAPMTDDRVDIPRPTPAQLAWQDLELGMFIHFAPNLRYGPDGRLIEVPPSEINPAELDAEQWVDVAEAMGAEYVVFVAKHCDGFIFWQSDTTDHGVASTPWRDGRGDILADLSDSCRKRGMKLGVYLSPADWQFGATVSGKCATDEEQRAYDEVYRAQLREVLSRYGEMMEVWFDGSVVAEVGDILRELAPNAMVFQSRYATIRWVGNEEGIAPDPAWNAVRSDAEPAMYGVYTAADGDPDGDVWLPNECDARIRRDWLWTPENHVTLKSLDQLMEMYYQSVGRGGGLLLNNTPDLTGRIPEADARRSAEFGAEIRRRFSQSIAETRGEGKRVRLTLGRPSEIDHVMIMEDVRRGERVREYVVEGLVGDEWRELSRGTAIGHKKIDRFEPATVSEVRLTATQSAGKPIVRRLAVFAVNAAPPAPVAEEAEAFETVARWVIAEDDRGSHRMEADLGPVCREARQYEVVFHAAAGEVTVSRVELAIDGTEANRFVRHGTEPGTYLVSITAVGPETLLRATLRGADSSGEVLVRPVVSLSKPDPDPKPSKSGAEPREAHR